MEKIRLVTMRNGAIAIAEIVWATPLAMQEYRLENEPISPCWSYGDVVKTIFDEGIETWRGEVPTNGGEELPLAA